MREYKERERKRRSDKKDKGIIIKTDEDAPKWIDKEKKRMESGLILQKKGSIKRRISLVLLS